MEEQKEEPKSTDSPANTNDFEEPSTAANSPDLAPDANVEELKADDSNSLSYDNANINVPDAGASAPKRKGIIGWLMLHFNIYLALFLLLLVIAGGVFLISILASKKANNTNNVKVQQLSDKDLSSLSGSSTKLGDPKSTLNVESNAVFSGGVLIKGGLDVAGNIKIGGPLGLQSLTVSGESIFGDIKVNSLTTSSNTTVLGQLTIQKTLAVAGGATFGGTITAPQLNIETLSVSKDLNLGRHITAGGLTPGITFGGALGTGGTASVSGSDTAGTITINIGVSPTVGCFAAINFNQKFNNTPRVVVTPIGSGAAALNYYVTRTSSSMSICSTSAAAASSNFAFDYVIFD